MDAKVVVPILFWILAEFVRYCSAVNETDAAMNLIEKLSEKKRQ
jgi:hypothetical protein